MSTVAMSGNDSIILNNHVFNDLADGDAVDLTFPNDIAAVKTGKNGNSIYSLNETGRQADCKIRVIRGSADDKFLNNLMAQQQSSFESFVLMQGQFIKRVGDGQGNVQDDTYITSGGVFTKVPEAKMNVEGASDQSVVIWTIKFSNAPRVIT